MGEQAVALSKAVGYDSAGTVEFVAGQDRSLLLPGDEHAPAGRASRDRARHRHRSRRADDPGRRRREADAQAGGRASSTAGRSKAASMPRTPSAISCPPSAGSARYRPPQEVSANGGTVRNDTGVFEGAEISMYYDPMIAKLVTHAPTREAAIDLQAEALDAFVIDGVEHNIPFLAALMQHPRWREGRLSTGFIAEEFKGGFKPRAPRGRGARHCWRPSPSPSTISATRAGARSPSRWPARRCASPAAGSPISAARGRGAGGGHARRIPPRSRWSTPRATAATTLERRRRTGGRASRSGRAMWASAGSRCRSAPSSTATSWPIAASARQGLRLYRARGRAGRADAGEGRARYVQAAAVPDAGPRQGDPRVARARRSRPARRCAWSRP